MTENSMITERLCSLEAILDLRAAAGLKDKMMKQLELQGPLRIDASQVVRVGTACIQIILSTALAARREGRLFSLSPASPAIAAAIATLGLNEILSEEKDENSCCR